LQAHDDAFIKPKIENTGDTVLLMIPESPLLGLRMCVRSDRSFASLCQPGVRA